jgi:dTDP-4-dehydrorhamnose 3,5-epimerase
MPFAFEKLSIPEIILIKPPIFSDERGFFVETYKYSEFAKAGITEYFLQDNHSRSAKSVLRGLHYQKDPRAQGKLVRCSKGIIFDVAVDIRKGSPTHGQWVGVELSEKNNHILYVPPGFAHGFLALSDPADVTYKCTVEYSPEHDTGLIWNDPGINIKWPRKNPIISERDTSHPT